MTHREDLIDGLTVLFDEAVKAHHQAFLQTDGRDPQWADWYAHYSHNRIEALLDVEIPESELAGLLEDTEVLRQHEDPGAPWPRFTAEFFVERFEGEE